MSERRATNGQSIPPQRLCHHAQCKSPLKHTRRQLPLLVQTRICKFFTLTVVLFNLGQCQHFIFLVAWQILKIRSRRHKLDRVGLPDNFTDVFCFKVLLADIPRLVVKKAVRVSHPSDPAEENSRKTQT